MLQASAGRVAAQGFRIVGVCARHACAPARLAVRIAAPCLRLAVLYCNTAQPFAFVSCHNILNCIAIESLPPQPRLAQLYCNTIASQQAILQYTFLPGCNTIPTHFTLSCNTILPIARYFQPFKPSSLQYKKRYCNTIFFSLQFFQPHLLQYNCKACNTIFFFHI